MDRIRRKHHRRQALFPAVRPDHLLLLPRPGTPPHLSRVVLGPSIGGAAANSRD